MRLFKETALVLAACIAGLCKAMPMQLLVNQRASECVYDELKKG
jgi:hypothetical protein